MFLIKVTQMIQDQTANAIRSQEARRESRMTPGYPATVRLLRAVEVRAVDAASCTRCRETRTRDPKRCYREPIVNNVKGRAMASGRVVKNLFLSWCHADQHAKDELLKILLPHLRALQGIDIRLWQDSDISIGEDWRRSILARLDECDYGLLLTSVNYFTSSFIAEFESPRFVGGGAVKGALPVALKHVPLDGSRDLLGVDKYQIFSANGKSFDELRGSSRERFALDLATAIRTRILADT